MHVEWRVRIVLILLSATTLWADKTGWKYLMLKANYTSTNDELLAAPLRIDRISPGVYGLTGLIKINTQVDNSYMVEALVYRTPAANSNFVLMPLRLQKIPFNVFMSTIYRKWATEFVKDCSDLPVFEGRFKGLPPTAEYHLDKCMIGTNVMPSFVRPGFYKILFRVEGPLAGISFEIISQVFEAPL